MKNRNKANNLNEAKYFQNAVTYYFKTASHKDDDCPLLCNHYYLTSLIKQNIIKTTLI